MVQRGVVDGIRRRVARRSQAVPPIDEFEVRVESLRRGQPSEAQLFEPERVMEESARAGRVDHESRRDADRSALALAFEHRRTTFVAQPLEPRHVEVLGARRPRLHHERLVELRPVPVRIRDLVVRARRDHQLPLARVIVRDRRTRLMKEEREPALESACDLGPGTLPCPPLRERANAREIVAVGQFLYQQVRERRRGLSDRESRMAAPLDERDALPPFEQSERGQGSAEAGSDDGDVGIDARDWRKGHRWQA